jgi:hypothetical protein
VMGRRETAAGECVCARGGGPVGRGCVLCIVESVGMCDATRRSSCTDVVPYMSTSPPGVTLCVYSISWSDGPCGCGSTAECRVSHLPYILLFCCRALCRVSVVSRYGTGSLRSDAERNIVIRKSFVKLMSTIITSRSAHEPRIQPYSAALHRVLAVTYGALHCCVRRIYIVVLTSVDCSALGASASFQTFGACSFRQRSLRDRHPGCGARPRRR